MDVPDIPHELVSEFAGITGASPLVADHYLSACNYDLNRAVEFYFEHPPAPSQAAPRAAHNFANEAAAAIDAIGNDGDVARQAFAQGNAGAGDRNIADEDEELQRALAASIADAGLGMRCPSSHARSRTFIIFSVGWGTDGAGQTHGEAVASPSCPVLGALRVGRPTYILMVALPMRGGLVMSCKTEDSIFV